jgi:hypothetical protein
MASLSTFTATAQSTKLTPPTSGKIQVAVAISDGAVMIDFGGPWEVFTDVMLHTQAVAHQQLHPFHLLYRRTKFEADSYVRRNAGHP